MIRHCLICGRAFEVPVCGEKRRCGGCRRIIKAHTPGEKEFRAAAELEKWDYPEAEIERRYQARLAEIRRQRPYPLDAGVDYRDRYSES